MVEKSIALSRSATHPGIETEKKAHAVSDPALEAVLNDEELFRELFPMAIRRKIRRKMIGLIVQTIIMVAMLLLIN